MSHQEQASLLSHLYESKEERDRKSKNLRQKVEKEQGESYRPKINKRNKSVSLTK